MALTPDEIDGLRELILAVYGPVTEELLRDLCRCIAAAGQISSGDEYKLLLAKSLAGADDVIADTLRRQTDLTDDAVAQLMRWAAEKTAPLEENESLRNLLYRIRHWYSRLKAMLRLRPPVLRLQRLVPQRRNSLPRGAKAGL